MNIIFSNLIARVYGGGEIWMTNTALGLRERGHRILLLCRLGSPFHRYLEREAIDFHPIRVRGDFDPGAIWTVARVLRGFGADLVLTNTQRDLRIAALARGFRKMPLIVPRHAVDQPIRDEWINRKLFRSASAAIVVNSDAIRGTLIRGAGWFGECDIRVIYNGVDFDRFARTGGKLREELGIPDEAKVVGYVGRLDRRKGVSHLIRAFKKIVPVVPSAVLVIVGDGPERRRLGDLSESIGIGDSITFLEFRKDVESIYPDLDVLVLPSMWEGFGSVLVEAMAAGVPVVASNRSNIPEIVTDGADGLLVEPTDYDELATAISKVLLNPNLARRLGSAGKEKARKLFKMEKMLDEYERLFEELLSSRRSPEM